MRRRNSAAVALRGFSPRQVEARQGLLRPGGIGRREGESLSSRRFVILAEELDVPAGRLFDGVPKIDEGAVRGFCV